MKLTNIFSVDEPTDVGGRKGVVECAVECLPVAKPVMVVAFIAKDHRKNIYLGRLT